MRYVYRTKNQNYLIPDRGFTRFIDQNGKHIRWVDDQETEYLTRVLDCIDDTEAPKPIDFPKIKWD